MFLFATVLEHILVWRLVNILEIRYIAAVILLMPCVKRLKMLLVFFNTSAWVEWYEYTYFVCSPMKTYDYFFGHLGYQNHFEFPHKIRWLWTIFTEKAWGGGKFFWNVLKKSFLFFNNFMLCMGRFFLRSQPYHWRGLWNIPTYR